MIFHPFPFLPTNHSLSESDIEELHEKGCHNRSEWQKLIIKKMNIARRRWSTGMHENAIYLLKMSCTPPERVRSMMTTFDVVDWCQVFNFF